MLGIISAIIIISILISISLWILIIGSNLNKSNEEIENENLEEMDYIKNFKCGGKKLDKENLYTWEQVKAFSIIALYDLINSANEITINNMNMFIEPLKNLYKENDSVEFANKILLDEKSK